MELGKIASSFILIVAVLAAIFYLTEAEKALFSLDWFYFALGVVVYLLSIIVWLFSWAYLIKKDASLSYWQVMVVGMAAVFGSLTPVQFGSEALRSLKLKQYFGMPFAKSVSASFIVKGAKFLILALFASLILFSLMLSSLSTT